jgi:ElaA protein
METEWIYRPFERLTAKELYDALHLRSKVFVVEQNCVYLDPDGKDEKCFHLLGYQNGRLVACSRIVPPGISYPELSFGRVVTDPDFRGIGLGRQLLHKTMELCLRHFGDVAIHIGAQLYLRDFYAGVGFKQIGTPYVEDGIPHISMIRQP